MISRAKAGTLQQEDLLMALEKTSRQAHRAGQIIHRIRNFVKRREPQRTPSRAADLVEDTLELAGIVLRRHNVAIHSYVAQRLPQLMVDPILIEQVLLNLIKNAAEAIDNAQQPPQRRTIELRVVPRHTPEIGGVIEFAVTDTGPGLKEEVIGRLYEAFFSTKTDGLGNYMPKILVNDDEKSIRSTLKEILEYENYHVDEAADGNEGIVKSEKEKYDIILCDIKMPKMDGIEVLEKLHERNPDIPVVMISGHGNIDTAVEAIKKGAFDFISKPLDLNRMLITMRNALDRSSLITETRALKKKISKTTPMIGESEPILKIREMISRIAPTEARVLITGGNGTGKELVARLIHEKSNRANAPLIEVNCAAIPSELIESELFGQRVTYAQRTTGTNLIVRAFILQVARDVEQINTRREIAIKEIRLGKGRVKFCTFTGNSRRQRNVLTFTKEVTFTNTEVR